MAIGDRIAKHGATRFFSGFLRRLGKLPVLLVVIFLGSSLAGGTAWAQVVPPFIVGPPGNIFAPNTLKLVQVIEPPNLMDYVKDKNAAIALGKALFWDVQVSSDAQIACASCHFNAGADSRATNSLNPGFNKRFNAGPVNSTLTTAQYPFHQRANPAIQKSVITRNWDDVTGSQGVLLTRFDGIVPGQAVELGTPLPDPTFTAGATKVRAVTGRNAPTMIDAAFNFASFWDGRANNVFNGVNPFGPADSNARVFATDPLNPLTLTPEVVRMRMASPASQAVGPPLSDVEMSYRGRTFPIIGKKMLVLKPLAQQAVRSDDSVLGPYADTVSGTGLVTPITGAPLTYADMVAAAFKDKYWANATWKVTYNAGVGTPSAGAPALPTEFAQMEANFSLFFGLAIMLYENTLIANDTPFDRFQEGHVGVLSPRQEFGLEAFIVTGCDGCHAGPEFTAHNQIELQGLQPLSQNPRNTIAIAVQNRFGFVYEDETLYNVGVRPTREDLGRGGATPPGLDTRPRPLNRNRSFPLAYSTLSFAKLAGKLPDLPGGLGLATFTPDFPDNPPFTRRNDTVKGAFKIPTLRNAQLTGPFFHNGSAATLMQVVDFYTRGGNFPSLNARNLNPLILSISLLQETTPITPASNPYDDPANIGRPIGEVRQEAIVDFILSLTDSRVRDEAGPFDHPALTIPQGSAGPAIVLPAVGAAGRAAQSLPLLQGFLGITDYAQHIVP
ncbi:MAG: cytochrome-c peroxidase [Deltaproteobacteria bacterium]|nr:cytochrome-c peroxidase [Deltaproteobacteria bacterium]